ncbi:MAG: hypothetical protein AAFU85_32565 [Planctomycetota bacterium]
MRNDRAKQLVLARTGNEPSCGNDVVIEDERQRWDTEHVHDAVLEPSRSPKEGLRDFRNGTSIVRPW